MHEGTAVPLRGRGEYTVQYLLSAQMIPGSRQPSYPRLHAFYWLIVAQFKFPLYGDIFFLDSHQH